jgi:hypothetical protein
MTLDDEQNVWVCYGVNNLWKYNSENSTISYYTLGGTFEIESVWGGISCDHFNYIWVIHQKDEKLYVFNSNNINEIYSIDLNYRRKNTHALIRMTYDSYNVHVCFMIDEAKANSEYWSTFHGDGKKAHH